MTPEEMEAENLKYSHQVAIILRLSSGAFAVFNAQRRLLLISESMEAVGRAVYEAASTISLPTRVPQALTLEDLGL